MIIAGCLKKKKIFYSQVYRKRRYCVTIDNLHANCFNSAFIHISNAAEEVVSSLSETVSQDVVRTRYAEG